MKNKIYCIKITFEEMEKIYLKAGWFKFKILKKGLELPNGYVVFRKNKYTGIVHCLVISDNLIHTVEKFKWLLYQIK